MDVEGTVNGILRPTPSGESKNRKIPACWLVTPSQPGRTKWWEDKQTRVCLLKPTWAKAGKWRWCSWPRAYTGTWSLLLRSGYRQLLLYRMRKNWLVTNVLRKVLRKTEEFTIMRWYRKSQSMQFLLKSTLWKVECTAYSLDKDWTICHMYLTAKWNDFLTYPSPGYSTPSSIQGWEPCLQTRQRQFGHAGS